MLRRYNSHNLDTLVLKSKRTTIGSGSGCDIIVKGKGIAPIHASIEATPGGFWLREHSLSAVTKVNEHIIVGQIEIRAGDMLQFGSNPPFIFDNQWIAGSRPTSAKNKIEPKPSILPVLGKKMNPLPAGNRQGSTSKRILQTRSIDQGIEKEKNHDKQSRSSASSTESSSRDYYQNGSKSVGNNLLQRVVRLQDELIKRDEKIRQLMSMTASPIPPSDSFYPNTSHIPFSQQYPIALQPIVQRTNRFGSFPQNSISRNQQRNTSFELYAYRGFVSAIAQQLKSFNDRVLRNSQREYAEVFTGMCRAIDVPLSNRITEIEKVCESFLIDNDFEENEELLAKLDNFIRESRREKIVELTNELEVIMPIIRDAASNARENIKVCNVFTQWSRQFGDLIRSSNFSSTILFQSIDELKKQFADAHMSRHWLPPSITPILRLAALEIEKKEAELFSDGYNSIPQQIPMVRKKSIDETLDSCISHVETIEHEIEYHISRLEAKAKDYGAVQSLDSEKVARITKIMESLKSDVSHLSHFTKPDNVHRTNSVLFFEVTGNDIGEAIRKDSESTNDTVSRKISNTQKVVVDNRKEELEKELIETLQRMAKVDLKNQDFEEGSSNNKTVIVSETLIKTLIRRSNELLQKYEDAIVEDQLENSNERRKRSIAPIEDDAQTQQIIVSAAQICSKPAMEESETVTTADATIDQETSEEAGKSDNENEGGIQIEEPVESNEKTEENTDKKEHEIESEKYENQLEMKDQNMEHEESKHEEKNQELESDKTAEPNGKVELEDNDHELEPEAEAETPSEKTNEEDVGVSEKDGEDHEENSEYEDESSVGKETDNEDDKHSEEQDSNHEQESSHEQEDASSVNEENVVQIQVPTKLPESPVIPSYHVTELEPPSEEPVQIHRIELEPELPENEMVIEKFEKRENEPENTETEGETPTSGDIDYTEKRSLLKSQSEERITSHYRSHINTANGRPNIVYQYPALPRRRFNSPPMKKRSKSEGKLKKGTLLNRPRFVLY